MRLVFILIISLVFLGFVSSENKNLSKDLKEISGWVFVNDSTLVAHNDSGDNPRIYVLNKNGKIHHSVLIENAANIDMEDITFDGEKYLYIGDFGNNSNNRKNLAIYKVKVQDVLNNEDLNAEIINFSYPEQKDFPPDNANLYYDCEALAFIDDSLYLFTKNRTEPFDGKCMIYKLPTKAGTFQADFHNYIVIGKRDWYRDAITAADFKKNKLFLLTYNRVISYSFNTGKIKYLAHQTFNPITQKEALAIGPNNKLYIADERNKLTGGGHLYVVDEPKKEKKNEDK